MIKFLPWQSELLVAAKKADQLFTLACQANDQSQTSHLMIYEKFVQSGCLGRKT
tara:strand:- start:1355 stop:1516 length:162 start_codon:yes stop_codon:yes gene_type:complete